MKKWIFGVLFLGFLASAAYAAVTVEQDGTNKGVVEKINFKNVTVTKSGQRAVVDLGTATNLDGINWTDVQLQAVGVSGVNWQFLAVPSGGVNWTAVSNNAATANIVCWKSNGQPGKCAGGVSGSACGSCN